MCVCVCVCVCVYTSLVAQSVKNLTAVQETWVQSQGWEDPWRRKWQLTQVFLPGEFHGQRILTGYSSWVCKELDMTEQLSTSMGSAGNRTVKIIHNPYLL